MGKITDKINEILAARFDDLNEQFNLAEDRLRSLKPSHAVWVPCEYPDNPSDSDNLFVLGIDKLNGKWRLVYAPCDRTTGVYNVKPIIECPAEVRIHAASKVRELHSEILKCKKSRNQALEDAINELDAFCNQTLISGILEEK